MDRRISVAIQIVRLERNRNVSIRELARRVNLSPWHFTHLFRAETSISPKQFIRDYKLKLAAQLLRESFLSVKEVAATVGIGDRSHFSRDFKKFMGAPLQPQDTSTMPVLQKTSKAGYAIASSATKKVLQLPLP